MKSTQGRIDANTVVDLEMDRSHMIDYLMDTDNISYEQLITLKEHYESLCDHKLLKLESAIWLILIWKEIYRRDHMILKN